MLQYALGDVTFLEYGDTVTLITPSGGGYGNPQERDAELIQEDIKHGYVSKEALKRDYHVTLEP